MPKPVPQRPRAGSTAEDTAGDPTAALTPAPDNGVPFAEQRPQTSAAARQPVNRRGKQLGMRVPDAIYDRLVRAADETGFTKSSLLAHALDEKLKALGY